jgi:quercetin dioxygenase-like cupin family protein
MKLSAILAVLVLAATALAQDAGVVRTLAENKVLPMPGLPTCIRLAVENGDPAKGQSIILFKGTTGCLIPWHWHTATEHVMLVSGSAKVEMKDEGKSSTFGPGGYVMFPGKHVHQFTCPAACTAFLYSDAAFDVHYVDDAGNEIPPETALKKKK